ncbi:unnamed protein product [Diabrotica balteata]|uniref:C2H2-type domain-containing protein n=1 Tax=Diabrotica balteata TaxID=107213 RepID=A0A9P0DUS9_DIABA|nr:unnamed protein product [Diabrotica balteata]
MGKMSDEAKDPPVCRTCLCIITGRSYGLHENSGLGDGLKYTHILRSVVPALYLGLSNGPEICAVCKDSLITSYKFKNKCLEVETLICNYLQNQKLGYQVVELSSVIKQIKMNTMKKTADIILSDWNDDSNEGTTSSGKPLNTMKKPGNWTDQPAVEPNKSLVVSNSIQPLQVQLLSQVQDSILVTDNKGTFFNIQPIINSTPPKLIPIGQQGQLVKIKEEKDDFDQESVTRQQPQAQKQMSTSNTEENVLGICEDTGYLKDQNGHYFDFYGNALERDEVEAEKNRAISMEKELCKIANVFTLNEEAGKNEKKDSQLSVEKTVDDTLNEETGKNEKKDSQLSGEKKVDDEKIPNKVNTEVSQNNTENALNKTTPPSTSEINQTSSSTSEINQTSSSKPITYLRPVNINNLLAKEHLRTYCKANTENKNVPATQPEFKSLSELLKNNKPLDDDTSTAPIRIKEEPVSILDDDDDEDTMSLPEEISQPPIVQKIINTLYSEEDRDKYVDTPDLIRIQNCSISDIRKMQMELNNQQEITNTSKLKTAAPVTYKSPNKAKFSGMLVNAHVSKIPKNVLKYPKFLQSYFFNKEEATVSLENNGTLYQLQIDKDGNIINQKSQPVALSGSQTSVSQAPQTPVNKSPVSKQTSNVKRSPVQRSLIKPEVSLKPEQAKKKRFRIEPVGYDFDPESKDSQVMNKQPKEPNKSNVLFTQHEIKRDEDEKSWDPNNSSLVPTFYNYEGYFIHDHDYLQSPYVRSGMLEKTGKFEILSCYICGFVHPIEKHLHHMVRHSRFCKVCKRSFRNALMCNTHIKNHKVDCTKCGKKVPVETLKNHSKNNCESLGKEKVFIRQGLRAPMMSWTPEHDVLLKKTWEENAQLSTKNMEEVLATKFREVFGEKFKGSTLRIKASAIKKNKRVKVEPNEKHSKIDSDVNLGASTSSNRIEDIKCKKEKPEEKSLPNPYVLLPDVLITHPEAAPTVSPCKSDENKKIPDKKLPDKELPDKKLPDKKLDKVGGSESSDSPDHESDPDYSESVPQKRRRFELPRRSVRSKQNSNRSDQVQIQRRCTRNRKPLLKSSND